MAKIAFILLCHKDPEAIIDQANRLTAAGDCMAIHFDRRASRSDYKKIRESLAHNPNVTFVKKNVKCGWGEWSLVKATLAAVTAALDAFPRATHFYMVSGDCMAIKSAVYAHKVLDSNDVDYIESFDYFSSGWIKTGMQSERLIYRHFLNERKYKTLFYFFLDLQKKLGLKREIPEDLQVMIGSQWWCLRRRTVEAVVNLTKKRRDIMRFFRWTWIPDETFFQTIVRHLVPDKEISTQTLTFLMFTDYGMPVTFYNDHYDLLLGQDYLFARKISPDAKVLKQKLGDVYASEDVEFNFSNEGRRLFKFLVEMGRAGQRYGPRFWETDSTVGGGRELLIIVAKKWHLGKRLIYHLPAYLKLPVVEYLFDEESCPLPNLGGIETNMEKRLRHRRALVRILFDYYDSKRLVICVDSGDVGLLRDFFTDRADTRLLELVSDFSDEDIRGHAVRIGLLGEHTDEKNVKSLVQTVHAGFRAESESIRDAGFDNCFRIEQTSPLHENARILARFFSMTEEDAREILGENQEFWD